MVTFSSLISRASTEVTSNRNAAPWQTLWRRSLTATTIGVLSKVQALHAYVDESARGADYYVCAAITVAHDAVAVRRLARSFLMPRQRRWHFTEERTSRRRQILVGIVESGLVRAHVAHGKAKT